jgi:hypothetical protein
MSFFFDVLSTGGFVLASDVRLLTNGQHGYCHKVVPSGQNSKVRCAIAVCGQYPKACIDFFIEAHSMKDSLRNIAQHFAAKWIKKYGGTSEYSAVHLVGYEKMSGAGAVVPQLWYWRTWDEGRFLDEAELYKELSSFSEAVPLNNHLPWLIKRLTGKFPRATTLQEEGIITMNFLQRYEPFFTWNGDSNFWASAEDAVGSAMNLIWKQKASWQISKVAQLTGTCLEFLAKLGNLLPETTVGLAPDDQFDVLTLTPSGTEWIKQAEW